MSCVAGLVNNNRVALAAESSATLDSLYIPEKTPKLIRLNVTHGYELLIGCVGSARIIQIIQFYLKNEIEGLAASRVHDMDTLEFMVTVFVPALKESLAHAGYVTHKNDKESSASMLVAAGGRLFNVMSDYQVSEPKLGYDAIGTLNAIAICMGSMHTSLRLNREIIPEKIVKTALEAVVFHEINCGGMIVTEAHEYVRYGDK